MIFRISLTWVLTLSLLPFSLFAQTKADKKAAKETARVAQIKTTVQSYGTGESALIEVKLKSGTKRKGYISEAKDEGFVVADTAAASSHDVRYDEVASVKPYKLPTGPGNKKTAIIATVVIVGAVVAAIFAYKHCKKLEREGKTCPVDETDY